MFATVTQASGLSGRAGILPFGLEARSTEQAGSPHYGAINRWKSVLSARGDFEASPLAARMRRTSFRGT
jgi:hypothetical protein